MLAHRYIVLKFFRKKEYRSNLKIKQVKYRKPNENNKTEVFIIANGEIAYSIHLSFGVTENIVNTTDCLLDTNAQPRLVRKSIFPVS